MISKIVQYRNEMFVSQHHIFFSSKFVDRTSKNSVFRLVLPFSLDLRGFWRGSIIDVWLETQFVNKEQIYYILGDFCEGSIVASGSQFPVLSKLFVEKDQKFYTYLSPLSVGVKQPHLEVVELVLVDSMFKTLLLPKGFGFECTIHLERYG